VLDSNEDGFNENNVRAICSIARSTKTRVEGFIGEKGIGFKSVFTVAKKVTVQSGPFCFSFRYDRKDPKETGMGLVTPINEQHDNLPEGIRTRIILYFQQEIKPEEMQQKFLDLPNTLLLFLKKLKYLTIKIELPGHKALEIEYSLQSQPSIGYLDAVSLRKLENGVKSHQNYLVRKEAVQDLPLDEARGDINTADIVLAFPVDHANMPMVENSAQQHDVFAFLPIGKYGFKVSNMVFFPNPIVH
jgi:hypothetical protein